MKKIILFLSALTTCATAQSTYYQYFDGANTNPANSIIISIGTNSNNIWQVGVPQKTLFASASSTPHAMVTDTINYYPNGNVSTFSFAVVNPLYPHIPRLQWKQKLNMDAKKDGGIVEFSMNSGNTWQNAHNNPNVFQYYGFQPANKDTINGNQYCFSGTDNTWRDIWLCLSANISTQNDTILFRFTFKSDTINTNKEGWMIDDMLFGITMMHPIKENGVINGLIVYPNMTDGIVNVEMSNDSSTDGINELELMNSEGQIVQRYGKNYSKVVLDISNHPPGLYYLKVTIGKKTSVHPVVYEKQ